MRRALQLAARAAGRTSPNPLVGTVIVRSGKVVGEGWYREDGGAHAEVDAIGRAGTLAAGSTIYVSLEPHAFQGRTPPCTDALIAARPRRVVVALRDPEPRTNGKGIRDIRAAGIKVDEGVCAEDAARLNEGYLSRLQRGRPHVTVKLATTVDGRVSVGGRRYLVGPPALREVHRLRDRLDAVLVGVGTVLADDPALTVREVKGRDPLRVVVDADARTPVTAKVVRAKNPQRTVLFVARDADLRRTNRLRDAGVLLAKLPRVDAGLDLEAALRWLAEQGVNTVLNEGGPRVAGALVAGGLADRLRLYIAPFAGGDGPPGLPGVPAVRDLRNLSVRRLGGDLAISGDL